jgi:hypothetical protein
LEAQIQIRPEKLAGNQQSGAEADDAPDDGGNGERANDLVVVLDGFYVGVHLSKGLGGVVLVAQVFSSASRRMAGVAVSSYCPERTAHTKAVRKHTAIKMLKGIRIKMTIIVWKPRQEFEFSMESTYGNSFARNVKTLPLFGSPIIVFR